MQYNWKPVIKSFFTIALSHGFTLHTVDNGGDENVPTNTIKEAVEEVAATDESHVILKDPNGKRVWFFLVLGNSPEETVCDYSVHDLAGKVCGEFSAKWEGKECPTVKN
jgi:hypothetical protein